MKIKLKLIVAVLLVGLAVPVTTEAQFLKKLTKGLEKVNKTLDKVEKAVKDTPTTAKTDRKSSQTASATQNSAQTKAFSETGWKSVTPGYRHPYLTSRTRYLNVPGFRNNISDVYEDIFAVKRNNAWEFWFVNGKKLFNADWEYCGLEYNGAPRFSGGVAAARGVKPGANGKKTISLLYADGRVKQLDPSYVKVSDFIDGLAIVEQEINYKSKYFFINAAGEKVFPALTVKGDAKDAIRPLVDDRRAYKCDYDKWGFIDAKGNPAFAKTFSEVRDFSGGYAWVRIPDESQKYVNRWALIDTKGNVVFSPGELYDNKHINTREITDVDNGIFSVVRGNKVVYYDVTGKELLSVDDGSAFYDGYAFVTTYPGYETLNNGTMVINSAMQPVRIIDSDICPAHKVMDGSIVFKPYGLVSLKAQGYVLNPQGNVVLETYDNHEGNYIRSIGQFSPSGYSKCTEVRLNDESYNAFLKPSGEITWMFSDSGGGGQFSDPVGPEPTDSIPDFDPRQPGDTIPKIGPNPPYPIPPIKLITVDINQKPVGPTTVTAQKFKVSVVAEPAEGGSASISPAGAFSYGETATVSAAPAKDWAVSSISSSIGGNLSVGKPFTVTTDQTITVRFAKKDDDKNPEHTGAYQGTIRIHPYDIPVYMQVNAEGKEATPYGDNTCGYLQIMFDPETRYTNERQELAVSLFAAPLQITGVQHDEATGRRWLVLDGGSVAFHDLKVNPVSITPLMALYMNTLLRVNNFSDVTTRPMHYRVEMLDLDPETGEFTFGDLQAYSAENGGWFAGGDKAVSKITKGVMATMTDRGYPAETFAGARMKKSAPRTDVMWYPPKSWSKTESLFEMIVKSMTESYRTARSDYNRIFGE